MCSAVPATLLLSKKKLTVSNLVIRPHWIKIKLLLTSKIRQDANKMWHGNKDLHFIPTDCVNLTERKSSFSPIHSIFFVFLIRLFPESEVTTAKIRIKIRHVGLLPPDALPSAKSNSSSSSFGCSHLSGVATADVFKHPHTIFGSVLRRMPFLTQPTDSRKT